MKTITAFLAACLCASLAIAAASVPKGESTVIVYSGTGEGSGFHIGGGIFVTAAHVVEGETLSMVEFSNGTKVSADVIMVDGRADIAFLDSGLSGDQAEAAPLACRKAVLGENVMVRGNPGAFKFISAWGRVSGAPLSISRWAEVIPINVSTGPGYSGGPVFDERGNVLAVLVGGMRGIISVAVPSLSVCKARDYLGLGK